MSLLPLKRRARVVRPAWLRRTSGGAQSRAGVADRDADCVVYTPTGWHIQTARATARPQVPRTPDLIRGKGTAPRMRARTGVRKASNT